MDVCPKRELEDVCIQEDCVICISRQSVLPLEMEEAETWNLHGTKLILVDQTEK